MCGILGIIANHNIATEIYNGLLTIQHRGQDACGILTFNSSRFHLRKRNGLVKDVFNDKELSKLIGHMGLGHVRYPTVGSGGSEHAQPFFVNSPFGIAMAHNGNVTNYKELKQELFDKDFRLLNSTCDVEVILNVFAEELLKQNITNLEFTHIAKAVRGVYKRVKGSYSVVGIIAGKGMFAFRDPHGIKPIIMGQKEINGEKSYAIASESIVLDILDFHNTTNIKPGELIFIDKQKNLRKELLCKKKHRPCIFEYVYFARPDSFMDKVSVYRTRRRFGEKLAEEWKKTGLKVDVVMPVPDSARAAAVSFSKAMGINYSEGLVKNRYIGRTFIMPNHKERTSSIRHKLNAIQDEFKDKAVLLIDDSIVRGNTCKKIINLAREAGAKKVYFLSYSAPLRYPCVYGIDMSTKKEFIARSKDVEQIAEEIGADFVLYQTIDNMKRCVLEDNHEIDPCCACFNGDYPTEDVTSEMFDSIEKDRIESKES